MAFEGEGGAAGAGAGGEGGSFGGAADLLGGSPGGAGGEQGGGAGGGAEGQGGEGQGGAGGEAAGGPDPDWYQQVSADTSEGEKASLRDWVKSLGVKDLTGLAKVARDNQAALRESGRIKVPGEGASAEEVSGFRKAIGVPDTAEGYTLPEVKDEAGKVIELDKGLLGKLVPDAHALGVPKAAFEGLVSKFVEHQQAEFADFEAQKKSEAQEWFKKQGDQGNAKLAAVDAAGRALGLSSEEMITMRNALGGGRAMEIMARLGEGMAEDVMLTGGKGRFGVTGREAQAELDTMKSKVRTDPVFAQAVRTKGSPENLRWNRLNDQAAAHAGEQPSL
jgi:hypothetical protein